jgi:hypothetical protein
MVASTSAGATCALRELDKHDQGINIPLDGLQLVRWGQCDEINRCRAALRGPDLPVGVRFHSPSGSHAILVLTTGQHMRGGKRPHDGFQLATVVQAHRLH